MTDMQTPEFVYEVLLGKHVMVVEDNGVLCSLLEEILTTAGCELSGPFTRVDEAMHAATSERLDAALLDIRIHGQLISPVAQELERRGVPVLLTSAYHSDDLPRALQGTEFLRKPFTEDDVLDRLSKLLTPQPSLT
jgi:DNA-binding response OmpR family regulator